MRPVLALALAGLVAVPAYSQVARKGTTQGASNPAPPPTGTWQRTNNHTSIGMGVPLLMTDGTVLVHRAKSRSWYRLTPDVFGSYSNGTWTQVASLPTGYGPLYFASAVMPDGRVVITGGEYNTGQSGAVWTTLGAYYDPVANVWTSLAPPAGWTKVGDAQCCVLSDGRFVLANLTNRQMAVLNTGTMTFSTLLSLTKNDRFDEEGWTLLPDGTILTCDALSSPAAEKYIPWMDQWVPAGFTPQSLEDAGSQELGPMVLMPNGKVFAMGATGHNAVYTPGASPTDAGTWEAADDFPIGPTGQLDIADGPACLLPNGNVLCAASPGVFNTPSTFFEYDGAHLIQAPNVPNSPSNPSYVGNMLMLPTGQVLFTDLTSDVEIYTPAAGAGPQEAWKPVVSDCPAVVARGESFVLSGTQFNGLSQCSAYGDDSTNATNYPLVRVTNMATGHVKYARTHDHSTMAVATGSTPVFTHVDIPSTTELGPSLLEVVTNGIASPPVQLTIASKLITGHVDLQNWAAAVDGIQVTIEIRATGTPSPLDSQVVNLDSNGNFQMRTSVPNGSCDITAKASHWLRGIIGGQTLTDGTTGSLNFSLINGDVNGDNAVTLGDFAQLRADFGTASNGPGDLNGDGVVTLSDFAILRAGFGQAGAP